MKRRWYSQKKIDGNEVLISVQPEGLAKFLADSSTESAAKFLSRNATGTTRLALAEFIVETDCLGRRDRDAAIVHLKGCIATTTHCSLYDFAQVIRTMLETDDPLLDWIKESDDN